MKSSSNKSGQISIAIRLLVAATFFAAGSAMLIGVPWMVELFERIGVGQWFRFVTGGLEVIGSLLLLSLATKNAGALLLLFMMLVAIATHVIVIGGSPAPAVVLAVMCAAILGNRRGPDGQYRSTTRKGEVK